MRNANLLLTSLVSGALAFSAIAQDKPAKDPKPTGDAPAGQPPARGPGGGQGGGAGGGGGRGQGQGQALSAEKSKAAWEAQAKSIASGLSLDEAKTKALVKAYGEARTSFTAATEKMRAEAQKKREEGDGGGAGGGRPDMAEFQKQREALLTSEREKFQKSLVPTLTAEQATKAVAALGTFNPQQDILTDAVLGFKLDDKKQAEAMKNVDTYVAAIGKIPAASDDREARRTAMQDARKALNDSMKKVLSEEQMKKFEATGGGGGGGPGGGGGGQRRGGGGGNGGGGGGGGNGGGGGGG